MKRVLLTGATGFIGRHCLPLLLETGFQVHAVSSRLTGQSQPEVFWHQADILDSVQLTKLIDDVRPTHLLHLAWYTAPGKYWTSLENIRWVRASLELLQVFASKGGNRVVMAGTCAEYDWSYGYCSESITPLLPSTLYGTCKHSLQMMLSEFSKETGLSSAWGRIFFLYGPHEHPERLVPSVIRSLLLGEPARCSHGKQVRDFMHVKDVASAFVSLMESDVSGPVNIASGRAIELKEIIYKIADKINRRDLVQLGAQSVPESEPPLLIANVSCLSKKLGWLPKLDLDGGLDETIAWWQSYGLVVQGKK